MKKRLLSLALALVLVTAVTIPAWGALTTKTIEVLTGVDIFVDGVKMEPKDANGNPVETFVYNGTTYVPLRAVSQSLGYNVNWDGANKRVYIGERPGEKQYLISTLTPYQVRNFATPITVTMAGQKYANTIQSDGNLAGCWALYNLNGQYTSLSFDMGHVDGEIMTDGTVNIYLDGTLAFSADMGAEDLPAHFTVPLYNALQMKLEISNHNYALANVEIN